MKKIDFRNLGKQFGVSFLRNRISGSDPDDERGFHRKNVDTAKDVAKGMAKDYLKKKVKAYASKVAAKVGAKIMAYLSPIIAKILIVIIIVVVLLVPVSYVYMMFMNALEDWDDKFLQGTTVITQEFTDWINGGKDTDKALAARESSYQEYLVKRFMQLQNQITKNSIDVENGVADEDDMNETDINELKTRAVMWVYGRIYTEYFEPTPENNYFGFYKEYAENSRAPALKGLQETAETIYTPVMEGNVHDARKQWYNDSINVYDIMAFDYLAGTLFDLLDLDLELMNQRVREEHQENIDKTIKEKRLEVHQKYADKVLSAYRDFIVNSIGLNVSDDYNSGVVIHTTHANLTSFGMSTHDLFDGRRMKDAHAVHMFIEENFSYSSSEDTKWLLNSLTKLDILNNKKLCEKNSSIGEHLIKHEYQYGKLLNVRSDLQNNIYLNYVLSFAKDDTQYNLLQKSTLEVIKAHSTDKKMEKIEKDLNEELSKVELDATKEVINKELEEMMSDTIKDLNLTRTQEAALSYRNYLTELEQVTTIAYHSLDLDYSVFKEFYKIPEYSVKIVSRYANGETKFADLINNIWYTKRIEDKSELLSSITESTDKYYLDASSNPIVFAHDEQSNYNFYKGYSKLYIERLISLIGKFREELSLVQTSFNIAKEAINSKGNPTKEQKEVISQMTEAYWETLDEAYENWKSNEFYVYRRDRHKRYDNGYDDDNNNNNNPTLEWEVKNRDLPFGGSQWIIIIEDEEKEKGYPDVGESKYQSELMDFAYLKNNDSNDYKNDELVAIYKDYNECRRVFLETYNMLCILNNKPTIKGKDTSKFFKKADEYFAKEYERLDELEAKVKALQDYEISNAPEGLFYPSNLSGDISLNGKRVEINSAYIKNNVLQVMKYKYTQEEAIKLVATSHYGDVLKYYKTQSSFGGGTPAFVGDLEIGTNVSDERKVRVMTADYYPKLVQYAEQFGIDPEFMASMIAIESGGITDTVYLGNHGLGQINGSTYFGKPFTVMDIHGVSHTLTATADNVYDPDFNLKFSAMQLRKNIDAFRNNLFMAVMGYNFGTYGLNLTVIKYIEDTTGEMKAVEYNPNYLIKNPVFWNYVESLDIGWIPYTRWYTTQAKNEVSWTNGGGTADHLERILKVYDTTNGFPYVIDRTTKERVYMLTDGSNMSTSQGEETYHVNNRLKLWKEYYTTNGTFKTLDTWAEEKLSALSIIGGGLNKPSISKPSVDTGSIENNTPTIRPTGLFSKNIKDVISDVARSKETELISIGLTVPELETLIATSMNAGVYHSAKDSNLSLSAGFKIIMPIKENIELIAKDIADKYIDIYKSINGKDKEFAVYLYVTNSSEESMMEIKDVTGSFVEFVRNNHAEDAESFTTINDDYLKAAQILSGDLAVDVNKFYGLSNPTSDTNSDSTSSNLITNPVDEFYKDWLEAKFNMHEIYNASTEEKRASAPDLYPALPTMEEYLGNRIDFGAIEDNLEGALTITTPDGKQYTFPLEKNFLTMVDSNNLIDKVDAIVIHDTANSMPTATANSFYDKMNTADAKETMHYVVDDKKAIHYIANNVQANHINDLTDDSTGTRVDISNSNSVGIQFAVNVDRNKDKTFWHTVALTKYLMKELNVSNYDNVILHNDVTGVEDSAYMLKNNKGEWIRFKDALQKSTVSFDNLSSVDLWRKSVAQVAIDQLGKKYVYGASGPDSFDCSGLTQYAYANNSYEAISIGRDTVAQVSESTKGTIIYSKSKSGGKKVTADILQPGDLLFTGDEKSPGHVMMWVGNGKYVHAANETKGVIEGTYLDDVTVVKRVIASMYTHGKFPFFSQNDPKWSNLPYYAPDRSIGTYGCGPTAMAMLVNGLTSNISAFDTNNDGVVIPPEMAKYAVSVGAAVPGTGTDGSVLVTKATKDAGLKYHGSTKDLSVLKNHLKQGGVALASYFAGYWTSSGHLIAIVGIDNNDQILVYDPAVLSLEGTTRNGKRKNGPQTDSHMLDGLNTFFLISA